MSAQDGDTRATLCSPGMAPLEDDDLLSEILLRLPPQPSSLPRASAVCKRWLGLVSSPRFVRRFRLRHRRNPPVLGFFREGIDGFYFQPTMEPPNRVPDYRFSSPIDDRGSFRFLGCRHGLVLVFDASRDQVLVWDPVTGDQRRAATPPGFDTYHHIDGAVLRAAGDAHHFQVVLVGYKQEHNPQVVVVCFYSSETGEWSNPISTPVPHDAAMDYAGMPAVLVGDSLYWMLSGDSSVILKVDLDRHCLAVIQVPVEMFSMGPNWNVMVMRAAGGGLGLLYVSDYTAQLWMRNTNCDGVDSWVLGRTIEMDKLLPLNSQIRYIMMIAYAEENNVAFLWTIDGIFMVQLESLEFNELYEDNSSVTGYPLESVYAAGNSMSSNCKGRTQCFEAPTLGGVWGGISLRQALPPHRCAERPLEPRTSWSSGEYFTTAPRPALHVFKL